MQSAGRTSQPAEGSGPVEHDGSRAARSQTLDRGLQALELVAESDAPLTIAQLARGLGVHRSIAYRIVRTLEDHRLLVRDGEGRLGLGVGLSVLARRVAPTLQTAALPELSDLANRVGMTAFLVVEDRGEAVTVASVEPRHSHVHVAYRPGIHHPITEGAPGLALLAAAPPQPGERPEVSAARSRGWACSSGEVLPGMSAVARGVVDRRGAVAGAVAVVYVDHDIDTEAVAAQVVRAASAIARELP